MFRASIELPRAIAIGRRVSLAAAAMADLISRNDMSDLADVYANAQAVSSPYDPSGAGIVLTAEGIDLDGPTPNGEGLLQRHAERSALGREFDHRIRPSPPHPATAC